ncbi:glycosyltransferase family 39 protein [Rhodococcus sp. G-MC3]|uniref:ArnT family glycosyltransferase n=1 Tax=Rhodococcus sp. G-MC3 TaxID=3046209 RepID=UPI0024B8C5D4|nr:glycosyltransferase family 39 protein [Rhodococcus sp. G-MC3]MDJ0396533.1 glycosyltransferase family 39 protein [Rhodococcus sp. G-MC3]
MTLVDDNAINTEPTTPWPVRHRYRLGLVGLLVATAVLYLWDLTASGYANSFYAASAQAGAQNWKAMFFASLDSSNFITVDKPPASIWVMALSARIFGFSSASILVPQALMGVGSVALVYAAVKRVASPGAGLLAGTVLALTPAAAMMFRFDNPDALLALLMTLGGYFVIRSISTDVGRRAAGWLAMAGVALGFAFLTKMMQGLLVLPAFGLVYLVAGRSKLVPRLIHLVGAAAALVVSAAWWVLATIIWPVDSRPYIGGSTNNTVMDLVLGYNGLGRIFGQSRGGGDGMPEGGDAAAGAMGGGTPDAMAGGMPGGMGGGAAGSSFGGSTGLDRLFGSEMGFEISWLIPAALIASVLGLIARGKAPRTDLVRASLILWGGWFVVTGVIFSYMSGTVHPYYTVALAPAIAGMIGTGVYALWQIRERLPARLGLSVVTVASGISAWILLNRNATWHPALKWVIVVAAVVAAIGLAVGAVHRFRKLTVVVAALAILSGLGGTGAYAIATAANPHTGSIPSVGPAGSGDMGGFGGAGGARGDRSTGGAASADQMPTGQAPQSAMPTGDAFGAADSTQPGDVSGGMPGAMGDMGGSTDPALVTMLQNTDSRWAAATNGSQSAAGIELATGTAVMAIGGWSGDPAPTLQQFQDWVAGGDVGYYIGSGQGGRGGNSEIADWVAANFTAQTVGTSTVYDLRVG